VLKDGIGNDALEIGQKEFTGRAQGRQLGAVAQLDCPDQSPVRVPDSVCVLAALLSLDLSPIYLRALAWYSLAEQVSPL
jgi:hypothetical protein